MLTILSKIRAAKFDYEYLGKSLEDIARQYGLPLRGITEEKWERRVTDLDKPIVASNLANMATALQDRTHARLKVIGIHRQLENEPLIAQLENAILQKAMEIVDNISVMDMRAPAALSSLMQTIRTIQDRDPVQIVDAKGVTAAGLIVNVQNNIN